MTDYTIEMPAPRLAVEATEVYLRRRIYEIRSEAERQAKPYLDQLLRIEARKPRPYYFSVDGQVGVDLSNNICISGAGSNTESDEGRDDGESQGKAS